MKLIVDNGPHLKDNDHTTKIMKRLMIALLPIVIFAFSLIAVAFSIGFQYETFIKTILGESFATVNPVRLGSDISWIVASSSIVNDFLRGLKLQL